MFKKLLIIVFLSCLVGCSGKIGEIVLDDSVKIDDPIQIPIISYPNEAYKEFVQTYGYDSVLFNTYTKGITDYQKIKIHPDCAFIVKEYELYNCVDKLKLQERYFYDDSGYLIGIRRITYNTTLNVVERVENCLLRDVIYDGQLLKEYKVGYDGLFFHKKYSYLDYIIEGVVTNVVVEATKRINLVGIVDTIITKNIKYEYQKERGLVYKNIKTEYWNIFDKQAKESFQWEVYEVTTKNVLYF